MSNTITLEIGEQDPIAFLEGLETHLPALYGRVKAAGLLDPVSDHDMIVCLLELMLAVYSQNRERRDAIGEIRELRADLAELLGRVPDSDP